MDILKLISESEDYFFEVNLLSSDVLYYPKKLANLSKPLLKSTKDNINKLKNSNAVTKSNNKVNAIKSQLYAAKLAKDNKKVSLLTKKLNYFDQVHKNKLQEFITKKQKYIAKTKELKFKLDELSNSDPGYEKLNKKYQKRKEFLTKMGINDV